MRLGAKAPYSRTTVGISTVDEGVEPPVGWIVSEPVPLSPDMYRSPAPQLIVRVAELGVSGALSAELTRPS